MTPERLAVLTRVADALPDLDRPLLVAVDGGDGAGKTWFADELAALLVERDRTAVRASVDDFHHPRSHRHAQGRTGETVWSRSFDYHALRRQLLDPWCAGAGAPYRCRHHDLATDAHLDEPAQAVPHHGVLVVDGVFAQREELRDCWDLVVWLEVADEERVRRMAARDGVPVDVSHPDQRRYLDAQRIYRDAADPVGSADLVVDNTDPAVPFLAAGSAAPHGWRRHEVRAEIRRFEPADGARLAELAARLRVGVAPWRSPDAVLAAVTGWVREAVEGHDDDHPVWVALVAGEVVGFVAGEVSPHWTGEQDAYVGELVVASEHGRQGVGAQLLAQLEQWARERGLTRIRLETGAANAGARAFYEGLGYDLEEVTLSKLL